MVVYVRMVSRRAEGRRAVYNREAIFWSIRHAWRERVSIDMWMMLLLVVMSISMHRLNAIDLALESSLMIGNLPC